MKQLTNLVALVTGASSGIGEAISMGLCERGATVCLLGRQMKRLAEITDRIRETAPESKNYKIDLTLDDGIREVAERVQRDFGKLDIVVHSAGVFSMAPMDSASIDLLDWQYRVNVRAPYLLTQLLLPTLKTNKGQVAFINSSAGLSAKSGTSQYSATKHALKAVADSLRAEVNPYGMRVLTVYPGRTASPMQEAIHELEGKDYDPRRLMQPEDVAAMVVSALTLPRTAEVTDIHVRPLVKS